MNRLFSSRAQSFRQGEPAEITDGDELRAKIHSLQNVMPRKILLVEDDSYYIDVIREALPESVVMIAHTWQKGLQLLTHELYDLVLISVTRGSDLGTLELMKYQRDRGDEKNFFTPFIALIGERSESVTTEALHYGCLSTVQKPFTASMMRGVIVEQLSNTPSVFPRRNS